MKSENFHSRKLSKMAHLGVSLFLAQSADQKYKSLAKTLVEMKIIHQFCFYAKDQNKFYDYVVKTSNRKWKLYKDEFATVQMFMFFLNISFQVMKRCTVITSKIMQTSPHIHILTKKKGVHACL